MLLPLPTGEKDRVRGNQSDHNRLKIDAHILGIIAIVSHYRREKEYGTDKNLSQGFRGFGNA